MGLRQRGSRIPQLVKQFNLRTIVETGCHGGQGLMYAKEIGMDQFFSCDISEAMVAAAKGNIPEAYIAHLDSLTFVNYALQNLIKDDRVLWFLDAHFPSMYDRPDLETAETRFPMIKEMELIKNSGRSGDVIVCDDIRVLADPANPTNHGGLEREYLSDEVSWQEFINYFDATHICEIDCYDTGGAIFIPRS